MPKNNNATKQDISKNEPANSATPKSALAIAILLLIACVLTLFYSARQPEATRVPPSQAPETRANYQRVLEETHTGIRLARLEDFLRTSTGSDDKNAARVQHSVLQMHEQRAWAALSESIYNLRADTAAKTIAKEKYIREWGQILRKEQLDALPLGAQEPSTVLKTFKSSPSHFRKGENSQTLAGAARDRKPPKQTKPPSKPERTGEKDNTTPARIRYARKPKYPKHAKRRGIDADITLSLTIDERGKVIRTKVVEIHAERYTEEFVYAARRAARRSRFHPKLVNGEPTTVRGYIRKYKFRSD